MSLLWLIGMPFLTMACSTSIATLSFNYIREGLDGWITFTMMILGGLIVTLVMILALVGIMLLRDYMKSNGLLRIQTFRERRETRILSEYEVVNHLEVQEPNVSAGAQVIDDAIRADDVLIPPDQSEIAPSETSTMLSIATTVQSSTSKSSNWLQGVTPREYRAYLRRREFYKERVERKKIASELENTNKNIASCSAYSKFDTDDAESLAIGKQRLFFPPSAASINSDSYNLALASGNLARTATYSKSVTSREESIANSSGVYQLPTSLVSEKISFKDKFRCKICSSATCINKDHVIAVCKARSISPETGLESESQAQKQEIHQTHDDLVALRSSPQLLLEQRTQATSAQPAVVNAPVRMINRNDGDDRDDNDDGWNLLGNDRDGQGVTFAEFIGLKGNPLVSVQSALLMVAFNNIFIFGGILGPLLLGRTVLRGLIPFVIKVLNHLSITLFSSPITIICESDWIISFISNVWNDFFKLLTRVNISYKNSLLNILPLWIYGKIFSFFSWPITSLFMLITFERDGIMDFFYQFLVGQGMIVSIGYVLVKILTFTQEEEMGEMKKSILKRHLLVRGVFRICVVLTVELLFFPTFCGWIIDMTLHPIIGWNSIGFYLEHPFISHMLHWGVGIAHLVHISLEVRWLRSVFRPGFLHFIRNSDDPQNKPLKEAIDRPLLPYFALVVQSAIFYSIFLYLVFGGFSLTCLLLAPKVVPFNFDYQNVLMEIPYDIISQIFSKAVFSFVHPSSVGDVIKAYFRFICRTLRLSSFVYGGRYQKEEIANRGRFVYVPDFDRIYKAERVRKMRKRMVEPMDIAKVPIVDGTQATSTDTSAVPSSSIVLTIPEPQRPSRRTTAIARDPDSSFRSSNKPLNTKGFTVVYCPDRYPLRMFIFLMSLWCLNQFLGLVFVVSPVIIGRRCYHIFLPKGRTVIDIHAFQMGLMIMAFGMKIAQVVVKFIREKGVVNFLFQIFQIPIFLLKTVLLIVIMGIVWPSLVGFYYVSLFSPFLADLAETPIIPPFMCWFLGLFTGNMLWLGRGFMFAEERMAILDKFKTIEGWWNMDFGLLCSKLLVPYTFRMLVLAFGPSSVILLISTLINLSYTQTLMLQRWSNLISLAVPVVVLCVWLGMAVRRKFVRRVRDEHYLLGQRLHNLERPFSAATTQEIVSTD